jgi:hypothetical protein
MQTIRREIAISSWAKEMAVGSLVTLQHTVTVAVYMSQKQMHKDRNIIFNGNFFILHSLFLQALTLMQTKPVWYDGG